MRAHQVWEKTVRGVHEESAQRNTYDQGYKRRAAVDARLDAELRCRGQEAPEAEDARKSEFVNRGESRPTHEAASMTPAAKPRHRSRSDR